MSDIETHCPEHGCDVMGCAESCPHRVPAKAPKCMGGVQPVSYDKGRVLMKLQQIRSKMYELISEMDDLTRRESQL